ncbi:2',3'-cyclic-nucleotide 3'-phosphodiesterase-like isoform X1 [Anneissia japonica]|uniref:2',3'-cyclic-nucleotide 3'-phosphodiesterase-like isoform X1 n=1 Tax=Anneissia japonica TaxID=1529436 RepID=UPI001425B11D|nr:2',3'-cyclic-nucleotide 3'-phosphodiesterase-like isoform X1 [Anneissia japonica]
MRTKYFNIIRKVAGSKMTYPFLEDWDTIKFMQNSRVMVFLSGFGTKDDEQSSLSRKIIDRFPKSSINLQFSSKVCKPLHKAIKDNVQTIVIDHASDDVEHMQQIYTVAHENSYIELALKADCKGISRYRAIVPTFYGWFLNYDASREVREKGQSLLLDSFAVKEFADDFRKQIDDSPKDLQDHFSTKELDVGGTMLHCTSLHYTRDGFEQYNERVGPSVGRVYQIEVIGFLITPRTFGARLKLDKHAKELWENGDIPCGWEPSKFSPTNGSASKAHLTLETGPGVQALQTGLDLADLVKLEVRAQHEGKGDRIPMYNIQNATLRNYGKGQAMVYLNEPMPFSFLFSGYNLKK